MLPHNSLLPHDQLIATEVLPRDLVTAKGRRREYLIQREPCILPFFHCCVRCVHDLHAKRSLNINDVDSWTGCMLRSGRFTHGRGLHLPRLAMSLLHSRFGYHYQEALRRVAILRLSHTPSEGR